MADVDFDGIADALPDGCLEAVFVNAFDLFPVPTVLTITSMIAHASENDSAPVLHGLQDMTVYYGGAALLYAGHRVFGTPETRRNRLLTAFAGAALFATSYFAMPNYFEKALGSKNKIEQKAPVKTDTTKKNAVQW